MASLDPARTMQRLPLPVDRLRDRLRHIHWIGGGSGAGKSTVAQRLAGIYGVRMYSCDEQQSQHMPRLNPIDHPLVHAFLAMDMDERWLRRTPEEMLSTFHRFHGEGFELIIEDLLALPPDELVVVEGYQLRPPLIVPLMHENSRAVYLLPTPDFRRKVLTARGSHFTSQTSDPRRAMEKLLERDAMYTDIVRHEAIEAGLPAIEVDGGVSVDSLVERVACGLGLKAS